MRMSYSGVNHSQLHERALQKRGLGGGGHAREQASHQSKVCQRYECFQPSLDELVVDHLLRAPLWMFGREVESLLLTVHQRFSVAALFKTCSRLRSHRWKQEASLLQTQAVGAGPWEQGATPNASVERRRAALRLS